MRVYLRPALTLLLLLTLITGVIYPLVVTAAAQAFFSNQANGSVLTRNDPPLGSALIGQPFSDSRYFWGRLSATTPFPYNAAASSGSNLGPTTQAWLNLVKARVNALHAADLGNTTPIPVDLVTASASGLDPHISVAAALYQTPRVARERGLSEEAVRRLITAHTEDRQFGILGEPRVNVLALNLALNIESSP